MARERACEGDFRAAVRTRLGIGDSSFEMRAPRERRM